MMNEQVWDLIIKSDIGLAGLAKVVLEQCTFKSWNDNTLVLQLPFAQKPLLNEKNILKIRDAISRRLKMNIDLYIELSELMSRPASSVKYWEHTTVFGLNNDGTAEIISNEVKQIDRPSFENLKKVVSIGKGSVSQG